MGRKRSRAPKKIDAEALRKKKYKQSYEKAFKKPKRNYWLAIALVGIFLLVLFMNSYFNYTSGNAFNEEGDTIGTRFFLSGPDPYYNMRSCLTTMDKGYYTFVTEEDPLLNYPVGHYGSARPPLFNMIAVGSAGILENFMDPIDALGWSMLFLPAIYGALLVFPVYGIGKELFDKRVGILAAFFVAIIPIHLGSGHGSSLSLFDHDSFVLLLSTIVMFFLIKSFKEKDKNKGILFAVLGGVAIGCLELTWIASQVVYIMIAVFLMVQIFFDIFKSKFNIKISGAVTLAMIVAYLISMPYQIAKGNEISYLFYVMNFCIALFVIHVVLKKLNWPWLITLPAIFGFAGGALGVLWYINNFVGASAGALYSMSTILFGSGVYGGQVSLTIGEASTFGLSQTVMSFGPALYWVGICGFVIFLYMTFIGKWKPQNLFVIVMFCMYFWLTTTAGRFLNDIIPLMVVFTAFMTIMIVDKINFKSITRNIKSLSGIRKFKAIKPLHIIGILFIAFVLIMPNTILALDAAVPPEMDEEVLGFQGYFGNYLGYQYYWSDACHWLGQQDMEIESDADRPGLISWWDYGFYVASTSHHPTVADNFQEGIECAGNFHMAQSEKEATAILIIRLTESEKLPKRIIKGELSDGAKGVVDNYLDENTSAELINIIEDPEQYSTIYDTLVAPEYGNTYQKISARNAMYQEGAHIITSNLPDYEITAMYHDMMEATGKEIRYYGIDGRDLTEIFGVFPFLSDRGTHGFITAEDYYYKTVYVDRNTGQQYEIETINNMSREQLQGMDIGTTTVRKEGYFNSFIYKNYYGFTEDGKSLPSNRIPCYLLKHWKMEYISPAVTINKYYEGVTIYGQIDFNGTEYNETSYVFLYDENQIPHDAQYIFPDGHFQMTSVPGNITLRYFVNNTIRGETSFEVSVEEAMWQTNHEKNIIIEVKNEL